MRAFDVDYSVYNRAMGALIAELPDDLASRLSHLINDVGESVFGVAEQVRSRASAGSRWHLGSMNDGLFIIDRRRPCYNEEGCYDDCPNAPDLVLNVTALSAEQAQAIVDAHNATVTS